MTKLFLSARIRDLLNGLNELGCSGIPISVKLQDEGEMRAFTVRFPGITVRGALRVWQSHFGEHGNIRGIVVARKSVPSYETSSAYAMSARDVAYCDAVASWRRNETPGMSWSEFTRDSVPSYVE
jgi:hypothetical protein